jgi:hypothetical protein
MKNDTVSRSSRINKKSRIVYKLFLVSLLIVFSVSSFRFSAGTNPLKSVSTVQSFQAGHIIDNNIFTNVNSLGSSSSISINAIQQFLNDMVGTCDTNGSQNYSYYYNSSTGEVNNPSSGIWVTTSRATYGQRYDTYNSTNIGAAPYVCINQYVENPSTLQDNLQNPSASISGGETAAEIIYNAAQQYQINPEVILVTLQKEQGLVTDNWPWLNEYQYAMGYDCPDTSGCSTSYADFYQQVNGAAWQFRYYLNNPGAFNYWIGNNTIQYNPNPSCGSSTVDIQNAATAALYIYTPYQPDAAVLSGGSDSCSTYGNYNFWEYFNSWFGPSLDTSVTLGVESGYSTVYVFYDGIKQGIPSQDVLNSWGLNGLTINSLAPSVFNATPTASTVLSRYATDTSNNVNYFADNGNVYNVSPNNASLWNNFPGQTLSQVSNTLINFADNQGALKPYVSVSGNSTYYIVDQGNLYPVTSGVVYNSWAGQNNPPIQLSSTYFNSMAQSSTAISSPEISVNGSDYVLSDGSAFSVNNNISGLLPSSWNISSMDAAMLNTFKASGQLQYMLQADNSSTIYLLNSGQLMGIPTGQIYSSLQISSSSNTSYVSNDLISQIPVGPILNSNIAIVNNSPYVINNGLQPIPSNLSAAYNVSGINIVLNNSYANILPITSDATAFVKSSSSPIIYFLDNGQKLPFSNPTTLSLVAGNSSITNLSDGSLQTFLNGSIMSNYITSGNGTNYLIDNNQIYGVPSQGVAAAWNLGTPVVISSSSISNFASLGILSQFIQNPNGYFCLIDNQEFCADLSQLVTMWGFGPVIHPSQALLDSQGLYNSTPLTPFVAGDSGQQYSGTIYTVARGKLLGISNLNAAYNLGITNWPIIHLDDYTINSLLANKVWQGYLAYDSNNNIWVLDGGQKRELTSTYQTDWLNTNITPTLLGSSYLSLMPTASNITGSIQVSSSPTIYGLDGGQKRGIPTESMYQSLGYAPTTTISPSLFYSIPTGPIF